MTLDVCDRCLEVALPGDVTCRECGHELHVSPLACRCARCRGQLVPVGAAAPPAFEDLPLFSPGGA